MLAEPTSICERALRHARTIGGRQPWQLERVLVIGAGAIGLVMTYLLRLADVEVWTASLEPESDLVEQSGARYVSTQDTDLAELGGFDLVIEAAGNAQLMLETLGSFGGAESRACSGSTLASRGSSSTDRSWAWT